jgi:hypothetical protein
MNRLQEGPHASRVAIAGQTTTRPTTISSTYHPFHVIGNKKNKMKEEPSEKLVCCVKNRLREGQQHDTMSSAYHPFHVIGNKKNKIQEPSEKLACCVKYLKNCDLRCKKFNNTDKFYTCNCLDFLKDTTTKMKLEAGNSNDKNDNDNSDGSIATIITDNTDTESNKQFQRECVASAMCSFDDTKLNERKGQIINWIRYTDQIKDSRKKFIIPFYDIDNDVDNNDNIDRHRQAISFLNEHRVCRSAIAALLDLHIMYPLGRLLENPIIRQSDTNKGKKRKSNTNDNDNDNGSSTDGGDNKKHQLVF